MRAIEILCSKNHRNIVQVLECGRLKPRSAFHFIDMELCDFSLETYASGKEVSILANWHELRLRGLNHHGEFEEHNIRILGQICDALVFVHGEKEIHRDLSPQNGFLPRTLWHC